MANKKGPQRKAGSPRSDLLHKIPLACRDERAAVELFEEQRWGETPCCPRCGDTEVRMMRGKDDERNKRYLWRCGGCKQQYTVRVGTIMEDSPIPFRHWAYAFWAACASKKGVSAKQIERQTGLSYKAALFLMHRIRWAMAPANAEQPKLGQDGGIVEFDETYVGGKPRGRAGLRADGLPRRGPRADFKDRKTPVLAGVQRGGRVKCHVATDVTPATLGAHLRRMVDTSARLMTDERPSYKGVGQEYASHETVNHSLDEYARGDVTTNRVESFFATLKRGVTGTFHAVSKKHLHRYVNEFEFRFNNRDTKDHPGPDDGERTALAMQAACGRRLTYEEYVTG